MNRPWKTSYAYYDARTSSISEKLKGHVEEQRCSWAPSHDSPTNGTSISFLSMDVLDLREVYGFYFYNLLGRSQAVNSISYNSDGVTFISADDLRINLWNQSYNIVDTKPTNMEDLTDIVKVLSEYRYKREKRFNILCRFFFYLQNVTQNGSFEPWKYNECLSL